MSESRINDPTVIMTKVDLIEIRSMAIKLYNDLSAQALKMDDSQFKTYCYVQATQSWLRKKNLLKIILD